MTARLLRVTAGWVLATSWVFAQGKPTFEVATIKPSTPLDPNGTLRMLP